MKTDLDIYCLAGDVGGGCGFYRIREPARVARAEGVTVTVETSLPVKASILNGKTTIEGMEISPDVLVFQRPLLEAFFELMKFAQRRGIACVVEIDDDLLATHVDNIAYKALHPDYNPASNWNWLMQCCMAADLVITSSSELARRYAPHGRFRVLRNMIPESELSRDKVPHDQLRVGWTGTVQTHPEDLDVAGAHINAALNQFADDKAFYVVGDGLYVKEKLFLSHGIITTGWVPREDYIATMNSHFDIGVVPLKLDQFNYSKSFLKALEMASQGIPSIASPTIENLLLCEITGNKSVRKPRDWQKHLKPLLTDRDYYLERSSAVRDSVRHLTYENHVEDWIEAWNAAIENRSLTQRKKSARLV